MKIAILFENQQIQGGAFNYSLNILNILCKKEFKNYSIILITDDVENFKFFSNQGLDIRLIKKSVITRVYDFFNSIRWLKKIFYKFNIFSQLEKFLISENINLIIFPTGSKTALSLQKTNYVTTLLDICHLEHPLFPEINDLSNFSDKELFIRNCIPRSVFTLTVSQELKNKAEELYPFLKNKLVVAPLSLSHFRFDKFDKEKITIDNLNKNFIFYPAHYSAHKNHLSVIKSLKHLKENYNKKINLICCGHDKGNLKYLESKTKEFNLEKQITFYRFQTKEEIYSYFKNCKAVLFLSLFGPVNIPPIEAWYYKKPLICNQEFIGQVKKAAILVDPLDYQNIAEGINRLESKELINELIAKGNLNLKVLENDDINSTKTILNKIEDYRIKRELWSSYENQK
jgi:hypothetical protein